MERWKIRQNALRATRPGVVHTPRLQMRFGVTFNWKELMPRSLLGKAVFGALLVSLPVALIYMVMSSVEAVPDADLLKENGASVPTVATEALFHQGMQSVVAGELDAAIGQFALLTEQNPQFRLAQLVYADLLRAKAYPMRRFGGRPQGRYEKELVSEMQEEAITRLNYLDQAAPKSDHIPDALLRVSSNHQHIVLVTLDSSRIYLFRNEANGPKLLNDYYVSVGKNGGGKTTEGDKKTPIGLYFITDRIPDEQLPPFYGAGALPLNYPNEWDQLHNKTGSGIWLHGSPTNTYSRPPRASDGCVALTNPDFIELSKMVSIGTPVIISQSVRWIDREIWHEQRENFLAEVEKWRQDWDSHDPAKVLGHYAQDFRTLDRDRDGWGRLLKERLTNGTVTTVNLAEMNVLGYPSTEPMVLVTYAPLLQENGKNGRRQYWRHEKNVGWKIVYEDEG